MPIGPLRRSIRTPYQQQQSAPHAVLLMKKPVGDPYWANVAGLWHFDDAAGSQTFADSSVNNRSLSSTATTNCVTSTAQSKFGGLSCQCFGDAVGPANTASAAYQFGTGDFTIEFWYMPGSLVTVRFFLNMGASTAATTGTANMYLWGTGQITYRNDSGGVGDLDSGAGAISVGNWAHICYDRAGTTGRLYVNGAVKGTRTDSVNYNAAARMFLPGPAATNTYIDELRLTVGVARYQGAFTPQTAPFPNG